MKMFDYYKNVINGVRDIYSVANIVGLKIFNKQYFDVYDVADASEVTK